MKLNKIMRLMMMYTQCEGQFLCKQTNLSRKTINLFDFL